jgi:hypothetical protein
MKPANAVRLKTRIIGVSEPVRRCAEHHRHLRHVAGGLVGVEVVRLDTGWPCAWGLVGRAVARHLDADGWVELTRGVVPDGAPPGCASAVLGAAARWARSQGRPLVSYTLACESGTSYRAAGWVQVGIVPARSTWASAGRQRDARTGAEAGKKRRWVPPWCVPTALARGWTVTVPCRRQVGEVG